MKIINFVVIASICLCLIFDFVRLSSPILPATAQSETQNSLSEISNREVKRVMLFAFDTVVHVSPDNQLKPGGVFVRSNDL